MSVVGRPPLYKYLKHVADQLDNKSFVSRRLFSLVLNNLFFFFFVKERERKKKRMKFKARFPEVLLCRTDYLKCLFLLARPLSSPSGFCHRWPAWPQEWGQAGAQVWGNRGLQPPGNRWQVGGGVGARRGRPAVGAVQVDRTPGRGSASAADPAPISPPPSHQLGRSLHTLKWKVELHILRHFAQSLHTSRQACPSLRASRTLTSTCLFFQVIRGKACCELVTCMCLPLGLIWPGNILVSRSR